MNIFPFRNPGLSLLMPCLASIFSLSIIGCEKQAPKVQPKPPKVVVASPEKRDVQFYFTTQGTAAAFEYTTIPARVSGQLREVRYTPGDIVFEGDPLFLIEPDRYQANVDAAKATLASAYAAAELAKADLDRSVKLRETNTIPEEEYQQDLAKFKVAKAKILEAEADLAKAQLELSYTDVKAPISGKTEKNLIDRGNLVGTAADNTDLTSIADLDPILIYFDVSSVEANLFHELQSIADDKTIAVLEKLKKAKDAKKTHDAPQSVVPLQQPSTQNAVSAPGSTAPAPESPTPAPAGNEAQPAKDRRDFNDPELSKVVEQFKAGGEKNRLFSIGLDKGPGGVIDYKFDGILDLSGNKIDPMTGTIQFRGQVPNEKYIIYPGQTVNVRVPTYIEKGAVVIRDEAIGTDLNNKYVLVVDEKNIVSRKDIQISPLQDDGTRVVLKGLTHQDRYIVQGLQKAKVNQPVEIQPQSAEKGQPQ